MSTNCNVGIVIELKCLDEKIKSVLQKDIDEKLIPYLKYHLIENLNTSKYQNDIIVSSIEVKLKTANKNKSKNPNEQDIQVDDSCINYKYDTYINTNLKVKIIFQPEDRYSWSAIEADVLERLYPRIIHLSTRLNLDTGLENKLRIKKISYSVLL